MYLQTSRLQYNLQNAGVFQKALSNKIFKPMLKTIISLKLLFFKGRSIRQVATLIFYKKRRTILTANSECVKVKVI